MNQEKIANQAEEMNTERDESQLSPEVLDKIKHPPKIDDVIREQSAAEKLGNQALVPEMMDEVNNEMIGFNEE